MVNFSNNSPLKATIHHPPQITIQIKYSYCYKNIFRPSPSLSRFIIVPFSSQWDFELRASTGVKTEFCEVIIKTSEPNYFTARKWLGMRFYVCSLYVGIFYGSPKGSEVLPRPRIMQGLITTHVVVSEVHYAKMRFVSST